MSRSGYVEYDGSESMWEVIRWSGAVKSAIRGRRGQAFLRELRAALDALPQHRLVESSFEEGAEFCALGALGHARGIDMTPLTELVQAVDNYDADEIEIRDLAAEVFGIPTSLAAEVMWQNDEVAPSAGEGEARWRWVRQWVEERIR